MAHIWLQWFLQRRWTTNKPLLNTCSRWTADLWRLKCIHVHLSGRDRDEGWRMWVKLRWGHSFSSLFCWEAAWGCWWFDWHQADASCCERSCGMCSCSAAAPNHPLKPIHEGPSFSWYLLPKEHPEVWACWWDFYYLLSFESVNLQIKSQHATWFAFYVQQHSNRCSLAAAFVSGCPAETTLYLLTQHGQNFVVRLYHF